MIPIKILNGFSEINETLVKYNSENIEFLYISIGSKFNEQRVMLDKTINNTNALYQMIPQFLQNPENESGKHKCIFIIDDFNKNSLSKNINLLKTSLTSLIQVVIINYHISKSDEAIFHNGMTTILNHFKFLNEKECLICNYVKFLNEPNILESESRQYIPIVVSNILKDTKFHDRFYEWCGYKKNMFNLIYNHKLNFYNLNIHLPAILKNKQINNDNDENILKNIYNITDFECFAEKGPNTLYDSILFYTT